ncbi:hypothetical protein Bca4012_063688 [Brassica carinata]
MLKLFLYLSLILLPLFSVMGQKEPPGPWKRITDLDDVYYVNIAKFAVNEHNKKVDDNLRFIRILEGKEQIDTGQRDYFKIGIGNSDYFAEIYEASVFDKEYKNVLTLEFFRRIRKCMLLEGKEQKDTGQRDYFKIRVRNSDYFAEIYEASVFDKEYKNVLILEFLRRIQYLDFVKVDLHR